VSKQKAVSDFSVCIILLRPRNRVCVACSAAAYLREVLEEIWVVVEAIITDIFLQFPQSLQELKEELFNPGRYWFI
jgi:hypothetical protein